MAAWEQKINAQLALHGDRRINGKVASVRTQNLTKEVLYSSFRRLHELGYRIEDPKNFDEKHVSVLVNDWWHTKKKRPKTIQNELSRLRVFFTKCGRPNLVGKPEKYLPDVDLKELVVHTAAKSPKSWASLGVNLVDVFQRVDAKDERLGLMLRMQIAFGLRREEVLKCMPHVQDQGTYFEVLPGQGKGGRRRTIPAAERQILDFVKSKVAPNEPLGWQWTKSGQTPTLEQNLKRYSNLMTSMGYTKKELGATGHGLRAQFGENYAMSCGLIPPSLGGTRAQLSADLLRLRMAKVSEALGHHRPEIVSAYFCAFGRGVAQTADLQVCRTIQKAIDQMEMAKLPPIPDERFDDCRKIQDTVQLLGVNLMLPHAHALWMTICNREGLVWCKPETNIAVMLRGAALSLLHTRERNNDEQMPLNIG